MSSILKVQDIGSVDVLLGIHEQLTKEDWKFSGRSETSRRTITASVTRTGFDKMMDNWIYEKPTLIK